MLHTLNSNKKNKKRVGRGGNRGKNAGHGHKGQKSRAGHKIRPAIRDELQRIPKKRGHNKNRARTVNDSKFIKTVTLSMLDRTFKKDEKVTPNILVNKNMIQKFKGKPPKVKIVSTGEITKALNISNCFASKIAKEKIVKAGGKI